MKPYTIHLRVSVNGHGADRTYPVQVRDGDEVTIVQDVVVDIDPRLDLEATIAVGDVDIIGPDPRRSQR